MQMRESRVALLLTALCVPAQPACGARSDLPVGPVACAKPAPVGPTPAPQAFHLQELPGATGSAGAVAAAPGGGILLAGSVGPGSADLGGGARTVPAATGFLAGFDAQGNHQWDRIYPEMSAIIALVVDPEGNLVIAGRSDPGGGFQVTTSFLYKLGPGGDPVWKKAWQSPAARGFPPFDVDGCGNVVLTGICDDQSSKVLGVPGEGVFVVEYDPSGHVVWGKTYAGIPPALVDGLPASIALDPQREILLLGASGGLGPGTDPPVIFGDGPAPRDFLAKLTWTGSFVWQESSDPNDGWSLLGTVLGGADADGEVIVLQAEQHAPGGVGSPTAPLTVSAQRYDGSGRLVSTTPLSLGDNATVDTLSFPRAAVAPSGSVVVGNLINHPEGTWMVEIDTHGAQTWSWPHPSDRSSNLTAVGLDGGGRPLAAGTLLPPGATVGTLFLAFDAGP
jgi:hypothetical protein